MFYAMVVGLEEFDIANPGGRDGPDNHYQKSSRHSNADAAAAELIHSSIMDKITFYKFPK